MSHCQFSFRYSRAKLFTIYWVPFVGPSSFSLSLNQSISYQLLLYNFSTTVCTNQPRESQFLIRPGSRVVINTARVSFGGLLLNTSCCYLYLHAICLFAVPTRVFSPLFSYPSISSPSFQVGIALYYQLSHSIVFIHAISCRLLIVWLRSHSRVQQLFLPRSLDIFEQADLPQNNIRVRRHNLQCRYCALTLVYISLGRG